MLLSVISMLYFIGGSVAFVFAEELAQSRLFLIAVMLAVVWISTIISTYGIKANSFVSTCCFLGGVLFPGILIIILGIYYVLSGNPINLNLDFTWKNIVPDFRNIGTLVLILAFTRTFTGIEAAANHAGRVNNPSRNFPLSMFIVVILGLAINLLGAASVAIVIPAEKISLIAGIMSAFEVFFKQMGLMWIVPVLALLVALGAAGGVNAWLLGPVKGLLATAKAGDLPPFFRKVNAYGIPTRLTITQGLIISIIGTFLLLSRSINFAFWISVALSMMIYVTMYLLMMFAAIYLRYKKPEVYRSYKIPGKKNIGMWIVAGVGILILIGLFIVALFPPAELHASNKKLYFMTIFIGAAIVYLTPFIIGLFKKPGWAESRHDRQEK